MILSASIALLTYAAISGVRAQGMGTCAQACLQQAISSNGCDSITDPNCICGEGSEISACVQGNCTSTEQQAFSSISASVCGVATVTLSNSDSFSILPITPTLPPTTLPITAPTHTATSNTTSIGTATSSRTTSPTNTGTPINGTSTPAQTSNAALARIPRDFGEALGSSLLTGLAMGLTGIILGGVLIW